MNIQQFRFSQDWQGGTFSNAHLDTSVNVDNLYSHPSVIPGTNINHALDIAYVGTRLQQAAAGSVALTETGKPTSISTLNIFGGSQVWFDADMYAMTYAAGDAIQFTTTAQQVTFWLAGIIASGAGTGSGANELKGDDITVSTTALAGPQAGSGLVAGEIRNGAIANIYVNGVLLGQADLYNSARAITIYGLTGTNVIKLAHSGITNSTPVSAISSVAGTSVSSALTLTPLTHPTYSSAQWRVVAQTSGTSGTWKIQKSVSGVWTDQVTGLVVGATDTTHVPGLSVKIPTGTSIVAGDTAGFTTDLVMMAIEAVGFSFGSGTGSGTFTSPVIDSGNANTAWFLMEWDQSLPLALVTFSTGNTPTPDGTWITSSTSGTLLLGSAPLPDAGATVGLCGLTTTTRGRYAQFLIQFTSGTVVPFVRDLSVFYGVPETDPQVFSKIALGKGTAPGPNIMALERTLSCNLASRRKVALDYIASFGVSSAIDQYLNGYGQDVRLTQYTGEPPQAYRSRVLGALTSSQQGGSKPFIQSMIAALVLGDSTQGSLIAAAQSGRAYTVTIPAPVFDTTSGQTGYPGMPGIPTGTGSLAQTIVTDFIQHVLSPVGSTPTVSYL